MFFYYNWILNILDIYIISCEISILFSTNAEKVYFTLTVIFFFFVFFTTLPVLISHVDFKEKKVSRFSLSKLDLPTLTKLFNGYTQLKSMNFYS